MNITNLISVLFIVLTSWVCAQNLGHRLGGDIYPPENSLYSFERAIKHLQYNPKFLYAELDVRESKDGGLIVFHDEKISPEVDGSIKNRRLVKRFLPGMRFENVKISDLTTAQIKELRLLQNVMIPTLFEVYEKADEWNLSKPLMVEIKELRSDGARNKLVELANQYESKVVTQFMAFDAKFKLSFPDAYRWGVMFRRAGYPMYVPLKPKNELNNRFAKIPNENLKWHYTTVVEREIHFHNDKTRVESFLVSSPVGKIPYEIRLGIKHGYDDTGDGKMQLKVRTEGGKELLEESAASKGWEWFSLKVKERENVIVEFSDIDTKLSGRYSGNKISFKVVVGIYDEDSP